MSLTTQPKYDTDLVNKAYVDKLIGGVEKEINEAGNSNFKNFGSQPIPPYHINDTWSDAGNFYICISERLIGDFNIEDWEIIIRDAETVLEDFITDIYDPDKLILQEQIDNKIETHYQSTDPSIDWDITLLKERHVGDYWYNSSNGEQKRWNKTPGSPPTYSWGNVNIPTVVYDMIDSKKSIYTATPASYKQNDMWIIEIAVDPLNIPTGANIGEYVFATQDSNSFDKTHWVKRDVYVPIGQLETNYYNKVQVGEIITTVESDFNTAITQSETDILLQVSTDYSTKTEVTEALIPINSDIDDISGAVASINTTVTGHTTDISDLNISQGQILAQVSSVETIAKSKTKTFLIEPTTPYYVGDRYKVDGIEKVCTIERLTGSYNATDWEEFNYPSQNDINVAKTEAIEAAEIYTTGQISTVNIDIDGVETVVENNRYYTDIDGIKRLISSKVAEMDVNVDGLFLSLQQIDNNNVLTGTHFRTLNDWLGPNVIIPYIESPTPPRLPEGINYWYCTFTGNGYINGKIYIYDLGDWIETTFTKIQLQHMFNVSSGFSVVENEFTKQTAISGIFAQITSNNDTSPNDIKWITHKLEDISVEQDKMTLSFNSINNNIDSGFAHIWITLYCSEPTTPILDDTYKIYEKCIRIRRGEPDKLYELEIPIIKQTKVINVENGETPPTDTTKYWLNVFSTDWGEVKKYDEATSTWINANIEVPVVNNNVYWVYRGGYHKQSTLSLTNMNSRKVSFAMSFNEMVVTDESNIEPEYPTKDTVWGDTSDYAIRIKTPIFSRDDVFTGNWHTLSRNLSEASINLYNWGDDLGITEPFLFPKGYFNIYDIKLEYGTRTIWSANSNEMYGVNFSVTKDGIKFAKGDDVTTLNENEINSKFQGNVSWQINRGRVFSNKADINELNIDENVNKAVNIDFGAGPRKVYISYDE